MTNNGANVNATGSRPLPIPCPLCTDLPSALIRHRQPAPATHRRRCPSSGESYGSKMTALHSTGRLSKATVASFVETLLIQRRGPKRASSPVRRTRPGRSDGAEGARREVRAQACGVAVRARGGRAECIGRGPGEPCAGFARLAPPYSHLLCSRSCGSVFLSRTEKS